MLHDKPVVDRGFRTSNVTADMWVPAGTKAANKRRDYDAAGALLQMVTAKQPTKRQKKGQYILALYSQQTHLNLPHPHEL